MKIGNFAKDFGQRVRKAREDRGMSQEDLADAAELHRTHISLIERGQRTVRIGIVARLAYALRLQPGGTDAQNQAAREIKICCDGGPDGTGRIVRGSHRRRK